MSEPHSNKYLQTLVYMCPEKSQVWTVAWDEVTFSSDSSECDSCGSHGEVILSLDTKCKACDKYHRFEVSSW